MGKPLPLIHEGLGELRVSKTLFYCDPPYFETEGHYEVVFRKEDHLRLRDTLKGIQGKFMVSYNDCVYIRELYQDFQIEAVTRINNLAQRYDNGSEFQALSWNRRFDMSKAAAGMTASK